MADFHILTKPGCPHCDRAKQAITIKGFTYTERLYDKPEMIEDFKLIGFRSFPQVYHGDAHVGTADQTVAYLKSLDQDDDF